MGALGGTKELVSAGVLTPAMGFTIPATSDFFLSHLDCSCWLPQWLSSEGEWQVFSNAGHLTMEFIPSCSLMEPHIDLFFDMCNMHVLPGFSII